MQLTPHRPEIDNHTIKLLVGGVALTLGPLTNQFAVAPLTSISESYYSPGWSQSIFIGFLFATAAFLLAYNGESTREMLASKVAAVAALAVALFPCACGTHPQLVPYVHGIAAAVMFLVLAWLCFCFRGRARLKQHRQARLRAAIYLVCGVVILLVVVILVTDHFSGDRIQALDPRLTFHGEYTALVAFGISWLTASRMLPLLTAGNERLHLLR